MRASVGGWSLLNIFIVFFIILAFLLTAVVLYYKGYKVNSAIAKALETYEGYNEESAKEINRVLTSIGYRKGNNRYCVSGHGELEGTPCLAGDVQFNYNLTCSLDRRNHGVETVAFNYVSYKITTYIYIDLPMGFGSIKLPVTSRTKPIYRFTDSENALGCEDL